MPYFFIVPASYRDVLTTPLSLLKRWLPRRLCSAFVLNHRSFLGTCYIYYSNIQVHCIYIFGKCKNVSNLQNNNYLCIFLGEIFVMQCTNWAETLKQYTTDKGAWGLCAIPHYIMCRSQERAKLGISRGGGGPNVCWMLRKIQRIKKSFWEAVHSTFLFQGLSYICHHYHYYQEVLYTHW